MRTADVVLCDLDGTLVDTAADLAAALNRLLGEAGRAPLSVDTVRGMVGHGAAKLVERGFRHGGAALPEAELPDRMRRFLEIYQADPVGHSRPYPGVEAALQRLRADGIRLAVVTNKPQAASEAVLRGLGLDGYFAVVAGGDRFPVRKPDAGHLRRTLDLLGTEPAGAVLVGDSATDLEAGRNAGLPVILVDYGYSQTPAAELGADRVISGFAELPDALARIGR